MENAELKKKFNLIIKFWFNTNKKILRCVFEEILTYFSSYIDKVVTPSAELFVGLSWKLNKNLLLMWSTRMYLVGIKFRLYTTFSNVLTTKSWQKVQNDTMFPNLLTQDSWHFSILITNIFEKHCDFELNWFYY